jgi:hypothetical protein
MTPGISNLGDFEITAAGDYEGVAVTDLEGMSAVTISARLAYGSGGTTVVAVVKTSLDQGTTWLPIARIDFATATAHKVANVSGLTPKTTPAAVTLAAEGCNDGVLGDRLRVDYTVVGTYAGSTVLAVRVAVR